MGGVGAGSWSARVATDPFDNVTVPSLAIDTRSTYLLRATAFTGLPIDSPFLWEDFSQQDSAGALTGWAEQLSGTGSIVTDVAGQLGGAVQFASGATAGGIGGANTKTPMIGDRRATKWYAAFRFKVTTAIDLQCKAAMGIYDLPQAGISTMLGVFGSAFGGSNANFVLQYDGDRAGSYLNLGVAIDTAYHVFEMYCLGDNVVRVRVDGGAEQTATLIAATVNSANLFTWVQNGTTAANRAMVADWCCALAGRPT